MITELVERIGDRVGGRRGEDGVTEGRDWAHTRIAKAGDGLTCMRQRSVEHLLIRNEGRIAYLGVGSVESGWHEWHGMNGTTTHGSPQEAL